MNPFRFYNPTRLIFGNDSVSELGSHVKRYGTSVLLVYGSGSIKKTGLYDKVMEQQRGIGATVHELAGVEPNPRLTTVHRGIEMCRRHGVTFVLTVGGGSAVITNWEEKMKRSFGSVHSYPQFSILDPALTFTVPADQTANGIVDIMSHVFEQYFSQTADTPLQERLCESILQTVIENGPIAVREPNNYEARANLMLCGTYALNGGMISVGMQNDWASHGIEHEISAIYDIAHGTGLAIVFPNWMKYVYRERIDRFVQFAERVWGIDRTGRTDEETALAGIQATRDFFTSIGAPATLRDVGIDAEHLDRMAEEAVRFGPLGSFKKLERQDDRAILESCL